MLSMFLHIICWNNANFLLLCSSNSRNLRKRGGLNQTFRIKIGRQTCCSPQRRICGSKKARRKAGWSESNRDRIGEKTAQKERSRKTYNQHSSGARAARGIISLCSIYANTRNKKAPWRIYRDRNVYPLPFMARRVVHPTPRYWRCACTYSRGKRVAGGNKEQLGSKAHTDADGNTEFFRPVL